MDNIIECKLDSTCKEIYTGIWQHDYGQILRITGVDLPKAVEVQFSLRDKGGDTLTRIGTTVDGVTEVKVPDSFLKNENCTQNYLIYAWIYVTDDASGNTEYQIILHVKSRPKPEEPTEEPLPEPNIFHETVEAVNAAADRAAASEQNAKASATEASKYAASASESAVAAEKTKEDALKEVGEKKQEAIEAIQEQEEASVGKIIDHTDNEIQRIQNQAAGSKRELEQTIANAGYSKEELDESIQTAGDTKTALDKSTELAGTAKTELDTSTQKAGEAKTALDGSAKTAGEMQETLNATVKQAGALDTSLGEKIEIGTQLKTDIVASGEKAVQDIQTAGSEQLGKMQVVAEEFTADREQITTNKEDIGSLKEDLSNKITKFYASNQGETHITDSDNGKIQDMVLYGKSEQNQYKGINLLPAGLSYLDIIEVSIPKETGIFWATDGTPALGGNFRFYNEDKTKSEWFGIDKGETAMTRTINFDAKYMEFLIDNSRTVKICLGIGDEPVYEPYTGGQPSPSPNYPQEIKSVVNPTVKVCGKNLWNPILGGYISNNDGSITTTLKANIAATDFIKTSGKDITVIARNFSSAMIDSFAYRIGFYDAGKKWIKNITLLDGSKYSIKTSNITGIEYIRVSAPSGIYDTIQIEKGSEATPYEPYTEQSVQLPYTLNAIPVTSGGNVTINGQQYVADRVVEKDGVFGIERNIREIHTNTKTMNNTDNYPGWNNVEGISDVMYYNAEPTEEIRRLSYISDFTNSIFAQNYSEYTNIVYFLDYSIGYSQSELISKAIDIDIYISDCKMLYLSLFRWIFKLNCEPLSPTTQ